MGLQLALNRILESNKRGEESIKKANEFLSDIKSKTSKG